ncbi:cytidine deaminase [Spiroplasma platyhelix]|uniref:Cytidine deaminase n=1 Tax=Spiroplasma platyhelix PALS-1 TaxID=1276218 RepID=A0A846U187_9MOLU|nr:cytidine deaminase [Spiroplasma platyhelix]MBE4703896.1 Cytidine deaminase [Spiroplasma platyhelix PALS-1]NKE38269.1 cytidine deaminase [Spiroplasma platyhelix PALS-1]UJB29154.1 cytidine deaminase [Spiroplasma platyhelix PALS-1]
MDETKVLDLLNKVKVLQEKAYVPYSNFRVAAIVGLKDNKETLGVNIENAAFPATICAERTALAQAITLGYKKDDVDFLFLITDSKSLGSPCGVCRQFMVETMPLDAKVYMSNCNTKELKDIKIVTVADLLPFAFMCESLKGNEK